MDAIVASAVAVGLILALFLLLTITVAVGLAVYSRRQTSANSTDQIEQFPLQDGNRIEEDANGYSEVNAVVNEYHVYQEPDSIDLVIENEFYSKTITSTSDIPNSGEDSSTLTSATQVKVDKGSPEKMPIWKPPPAPPKSSKPPAYENHMMAADGALYAIVQKSPKRPIKPPKPPKPPKPSNH